MSHDRGALSVPNFFDFENFSPIGVSFSNPTFGNDMAVDGSVAPQIYEVLAPQNSIFFVDELRLTLKDTISTTLLNNSITNLDPDTLLGVASLTNGILVDFQVDGITESGIPVKNMGDFLEGSADLINTISTSTETHVTVIIKFRKT